MKTLDEQAAEAQRKMFIQRQTVMMEMLASVWLDTHTPAEVAEVFRDYADYLDSLSL